MRRYYYLLPVPFVAAFGLDYFKALHSPRVYPIYYEDGDLRKMGKVLPVVYDEEQCAHAVFSFKDPTNSLFYFDCMTVPRGVEFNFNNLATYQVEQNGPG